MGNRFGNRHDPKASISQAVEPTQWLPFLAELAARADELALARFRAADLHVEQKPDTTLVTEADLRIEEAVRELCASRHPELGVFGEERGETAGSSGARLILDPIDATANFARGIPVFATLLAIEEEGEVVAGLVSSPALATRWSAARGDGAYRNRERVRVSGQKELARAQAFHGSLGGYEAVPASRGIAQLVGRTHRDRGFGDFWQHVLVAEGAGEVAVDPIVHPWDIAPLQILVEEAGGRATSLEGERSIYAGSLVTTNGALHTEVLELLSR